MKRKVLYRYSWKRGRWMVVAAVTAESMEARRFNRRLAQRFDWARPGAVIYADPAAGLFSQLGGGALPGLLGFGAR